MKKTAKKPPVSRKFHESLLGPCGFYCGYCLAHKYNKCSGCVAMNQRAASIGEIFCEIYPCTKEKGVVMCADCKMYPCEKYDKDMAGIFSESFIAWIRNEVKAKGPRE